ncbi:unnamed protein product [Tilletia controversa]|uniref:Uncharacterized protein n=3 Tax=Tilletia TaxID=13289 RepID=A0A8X7MUT3_9BASI|nr:hypothetical protein CF336_g3252 [Tilletia laevis]KAE8200236.1 hypothetical protein CF328_g3019 [Tilletia controversa]KAE8262167.1 hypothetical protein A4X03_0g2665 [Tilletia caries]KAE8205109.1 hypothetical protein CF335_g2418 [Tilletia laevis]KAE8249895.1 hypothetical protein A4X06_0g3018 [Tilletia controversa]
MPATMRFVPVPHRAEMDRPRLGGPFCDETQSGERTDAVLAASQYVSVRQSAAAGLRKTAPGEQVPRTHHQAHILQGHAKAVAALTLSPTAPASAPRLLSASFHDTPIVWSPLKGIKERRLRRTRATVNVVVCTWAGREILASGSDDGKLLLWDPEYRNPLDSIDIGYPVTALAFSDDGNQLYVGSVDNDIHAYGPRPGGLCCDRVQGRERM